MPEIITPPEAPPEVPWRPARRPRARAARRDGHGLQRPPPGPGRPLPRRRLPARDGHAPVRGRAARVARADRDRRPRSRRPPARGRGGSRLRLSAGPGRRFRGSASTPGPQASTCSARPRAASRPPRTSSGRSTPRPRSRRRLTIAVTAAALKQVATIQRASRTCTWRARRSTRSSRATCAWPSTRPGQARADVIATAGFQAPAPTPDRQRSGRPSRRVEAPATTPTR
jgi:hypothetical protein